MEEKVYYQKGDIKVNLTKMFGKGKEPTSEEFEAMSPKPYYTYEEGTRVSFIKLIFLKIISKLKINKL